MRFIIGFVFFGLLFYGLSLYLPDVFAVLVSWAAAVYDFFIGIYRNVFNSHSVPSLPPIKA